MNQGEMGEFLRACGATGPLAVVVADASARGAEAEVGRWAWPQPFALVGSDPRADLTLAGPQVSRRHALLLVVRGRVFGVDLGSRSGVTWNGVAEPSGWLEPGGTLGIGPYRLRLDASADTIRPPGRTPPNPLADPGGAGEALADITLEVPRRVDGPPAWRVRKVLTLLGRGPDCGLKIQDDSISRHHAALLRTPAGAWVVDLLSRKATRVNGARVRWARLGDGDDLHVGRYRLVVRLGRGRAAAAGAETADDAGPVLPTLPPDQLPALLARLTPPAAVEPPRLVLPGRSPEQVELAEALMAPLVQQFGQLQQQMCDQFHQTMLAMFQMFAGLHRDQMGTVRAELDRIRQLGQELQELQAQAKAQAQAQTREQAQTQAQAAPPALDPVPPRLEPAAATPRPEPPRRAESAAPAEAPQAVHARLARRMAEIQQERQSRWERLVGLVTGAHAAP